MPYSRIATSVMLTANGDKWAILMKQSDIEFARYRAIANQVDRIAQNRLIRQMGTICEPRISETRSTNLTGMAVLNGSVSWSTFSAMAATDQR